MNIEIRRSNRRTVSIKIGTDGKVIVSCPLFISQRELEKIINSKSEWINKNVEKLNTRHKQNQMYYNYNILKFLGNDYQISQTNNIVDIIGLTQLASSRYNTKTILNKFLKNRAAEILPDILKQLSEKYGFSYNSCKIISARKKWGSCDMLKNIRINYRLIMLNKSSIEYVCLHELCHTKEMNHSKKFWNLVKKFNPNYKLIQKDIKNNSFVLELF